MFPLLTLLPEILLAPILGVFVDRWNRKRTMIIGHAGAGICILIVMFHVLYSNFNIYFVLSCVALSSVFNGFIFPAFAATTSQIVPRNELPKSSALVQFGFALVFIFGPGIAGFLLLSMGLYFIFIVDVISFLLAIFIIFRLNIEYKKVAKKNENGIKAIKNEIIDGINYIKKTPLLVITLVIIAISNFNSGIINVLITPLVLGIANSSVLGIVFSISGLGLLLGSILLFVLGNINNRIEILFLLGIAQGTVFLLVFFNASIVLISIGAFSFMFCMGLIGGINTTIWQQWVPNDLQGRVFSFRSLVLGGMISLGFLSSGPLTEKVFLPLVRKKNAIIGLLENMMGKNPHPEIEILLLILGIGTIMSLSMLYIYYKLNYNKRVTDNCRKK